MNTKQILFETSVEQFKRWIEQLHLDFIIQMHKEKFLSSELDEPTMRKLIDWFATLPKEHTLKVHTLFGRDYVERMNQIHFFTQYMPKWSEYPDSSVGEYFVDVITTLGYDKYNHKSTKETYIWAKIHLDGFTQEQAEKSYENEY